MEPSLGTSSFRILGLSCWPSLLYLTKPPVWAAKHDSAAGCVACHKPPSTPALTDSSSKQRWCFGCPWHLSWDLLHDLILFQGQEPRFQAFSVCSAEALYCVPSQQETTDTPKKSEFKEGLLQVCRYRGKPSPIFVAQGKNTNEPSCSPSALLVFFMLTR